MPVLCVVVVARRGHLAKLGSRLGRLLGLELGHAVLEVSDVFNRRLGSM
jgi:hypothetical protein